MISPTDLFYPPPAPHFKTFQVFLITARSVRVSAPYKTMPQNVALPPPKLFTILPETPRIIRKS